MEENTFRVLLDLSKLNKYSHNFIWTSVLPREVKTVGEFKQMLMKKFNISTDKITIFLQDGLLLEEEPIFILKQNDVVRLEYCETPNTDTSVHNNSIQYMDKTPAENINQIRTLNVTSQETVVSSHDQIAFKNKEKKKKSKHHKRKHEEVLSSECVINVEEGKRKKKKHEKDGFTSSPVDMNPEINDDPVYENDGDVLLHELKIEQDIAESKMENKLAFQTYESFRDHLSNNEIINKEESLTAFNGNLKGKGDTGFDNLKSNVSVTQTYESFRDHLLNSEIINEEESLTVFNGDSKGTRDTVFDNLKSNVSVATESVQQKEKKKRKRKRKRKVPLIISPQVVVDENLHKLDSSISVSKNFVIEDNERNKHVYYSTSNSSSPPIISAETHEVYQLSSNQKNEKDYAFDQSERVYSAKNVISNDNFEKFGCDSPIAVQSSYKNIPKRIPTISLENDNLHKSCATTTYVRNLEFRPSSITKNIHSEESKAKNDLAKYTSKVPSQFNNNYLREKEQKSYSAVSAKDKHLRSRPTSIACHVPEIDLEIEDFDENFTKYPLLANLPLVGTYIAFKSLELDDSYCPVVSEYKKGVIEHIDPETEELTIRLCIPEIKTKKNVKFENIYDHEQTYVEEIQTISSKWSSLIEPRLVE